MAGTLCPQFNEVYSTTEKLTGEYYNGNPVYSIKITGTLPSTAVEGVNVYDHPTPFTNSLSEIVDMFGYTWNTANTAIVPDGFYNGSQYFCIMGDIANRTVTFRYEKAYKSKNYVVMIKYIKAS